MQWKMTHWPQWCVKTADNCNNGYCANVYFEVTFSLTLSSSQRKLPVFNNETRSGSWLFAFQRNLFSEYQEIKSKLSPYGIPEVGGVDGQLYFTSCTALNMPRQRKLAKQFRLITPSVDEQRGTVSKAVTYVTSIIFHLSVSLMYF